MYIKLLDIYSVSCTSIHPIQTGILLCIRSSVLILVPHRLGYVPIFIPAHLLSRFTNLTCAHGVSHNSSTPLPVARAVKHLDLPARRVGEDKIIRERSSLHQWQVHTVSVQDGSQAVDTTAEYAVFHGGRVEFDLC